MNPVALPCRWLLLLGWLLLAVACGDNSTGPDDDDGGNGVPTPAAFAGVWTATRAEFTSSAAPAQTQDICAHGGALSLIVEGYGRYTFSLTDSGCTPLTESGAIVRITREAITFDPAAGAAYEMTYTYGVSTLSLVNPQAGYDFDGDGAMDAATATYQMRREAPDLTGLSGSWTALSWTYVNRDDPTETVDLVAEGGGLNLGIASGGTYSVAMRMPDGALRTEAGAIISRSAVLIVLMPDGDDIYMLAYAISGDRLTLSTDAGEFDFDGDGVETPARMAIELQRH